MNKPIISFAVLLISVVFAFIYVVPAYNLNMERRADILSLAKIIDTSGEIEKLINKTKADLGSIDSDSLKQFETFLPETIDPIRLANNIQSIGIKNRIVLSDIKITEPANDFKNKGKLKVVEKSGILNTLSLGAQINKAEGVAIDGSTATVQEKKFVATKATFTFSATYETFQSFLRDLEKSLGLINLNSLSLSIASDSKSNGAPIFQYAMEIETYSLK